MTLTEVLVVASLVALGLLLLLVTRRQVASIVLTFGGALDAERRARAVSEALVDSLERQESFKDTFLAMLGHDLRNPLTAVSMAATYALEQPGLSDKTRGLLGRVVTSGERMGRMVDQLIDLTRARLADSFPVTRAPMDLGELASRVVEEERRTKPRHHFALTREGDLQLLGDDERLAQVLFTLLGNAAAHGKTREVQVDVRGRESTIVLRVRNEGETIPTRVAAKLFDPFARGPSDKTHSDGLGLGLYIAQRIVEAHGGTVHVRSEPGQDLTEIELELPRKPSPPSDQSGG